MRIARAIPVVLALVLTNACTVGPDYVRPSVKTPAAFKAAGNGWKAAEPGDTAPRGPWWTVYGDSTLNGLEAQVATANQSVQVARAQLRQARALLQEAHAAAFPTVTTNVAPTRAQPGPTTSGPHVATTYDLGLDVSWEVDLWGGVARATEASAYGVAASSADLAAARLSAEATVAQDYFQLRVADLQQRLLDDTVAAYQTSLRLTENQYAYGIVPRANVVQAQAQLEATRAQAIDAAIQRATLEHAIAILIGQPPADLSVAVETDHALALPAIPVTLPSVLLERRPDIAAAERRVAAANAQIGVTTAAFFPTLTLTGSGGFRGERFSQWLTVADRFWSLGPNLAATLLDGGLRRAQTEGAIAAYDVTVATYRQIVLNAFQEVEDNLATLATLEREAGVQDQAVQAARESVRLTLNQYKLGTVSYLNVVTAQAALFSAESNRNNILSRRLTASVTLLKALGGGWNGFMIKPLPL